MTFRRILALLILTLSAAFITGATQQPSGPAPQQWMYAERSYWEWTADDHLSEEWTRNAIHILKMPDDLSLVSSQGWELVSVITFAGMPGSRDFRRLNHVVVLLKRRKP